MSEINAEQIVWDHQLHRAALDDGTGCVGTASGPREGQEHCQPFRMAQILGAVRGYAEGLTDDPLAHSAVLVPRAVAGDLFALLEVRPEQAHPCCDARHPHYGQVQP